MKFFTFFQEEALYFYYDIHIVHVKSLLESNLDSELGNAQSYFFISEEVVYPLEKQKFTPKNKAKKSDYLID